jgi:hypothetical protein
MLRIHTNLGIYAYARTGYARIESINAPAHPCPETWPSGHRPQLYCA